MKQSCDYTCCHFMMAITFAVCCLLFLPLFSHAAGPSVHDVAQPFVRPAHGPGASDITIRSLRFRPRDANDPHNTFEAMDQFHATRLEWVYVDLGSEPEKKRIARVKETGRLFGGASSATSALPEVKPGEREEFSILDLAGDRVIPGFRSGWADAPSPGCMNNPRYRERHIRSFQRNIDMGVETMQRDEGSQNDAWAERGVGCYCSHCVEGFRLYLARNLTPDQLESAGVEDPASFAYDEYLRARAEEAGLGDDPDWSDAGTVKKVLAGDPLREHFLAFQEQTTVRFFQDLRQALHGYDPDGYLPMSVNNTSFQRWEQPYYRVFDFGLSELMLRSSDPVHLYDRARQARKLGKVQIFGTPKTMGEEFDAGWLTRLKRQVIATSYAVGGLSRVPWDIFQQTADGRGRYFGEPADYADLYGFVRGMAPYLEGYRDAGAMGPGLDDLRYGETFPVRVEDSEEKVYIFLCARPGEPETPAVLHVVDWREESAPLTVRLRASAFNVSGSPRVRLMQPAPYNAGQHAEAERKAQAMRKPGERLGPKQAEAYAPLIETRELDIESTGGWITANIPPLAPWGVLVVE